jgi:hypothetical protein
VKPRKPKLRPTGFSLPHRHFIEHLVGEIEKPPRKSIKEVGKLEPQIRWLKDETVFHLLARLLRQK